MSKFLLPILAGIAMVIVSGCGGAAPSTDDETNSGGLTPEQIEARRLINEQLKAEITACGATCAGYAEWLTANPDLPTVPIVEGDHATTNNTGHYLQGTATGLNTGDVEDAVVTTVTFNDAFDDVDDNPFDGFAYFDGVERRRYVGILLNTNMGAPLATPVGRAIWPAFIASGEGIISGADDFTTPTAFNLMVRFNTTGGTIAAFIPTSNTRFAFRIDGEFDAGGVITGTTNRRAYGDNTDITTYDSAPSANTEGTLRGLIGSDGAVGIFTTDAVGAFAPYSGGFVARPAPLLPAPDHALYVSTFSPPPAVENLGTQEGVSGLSQPTAEGFSATGLRFEKQPSAQNDDCRSCFSNLIVRLGGDNTDTADTDGLAMIYGRLNAGSSVRVRAGLLPGTDLGASFGTVAPDGVITANWPGTIYHSRQVRGTAPNQVLAPFIVAFTVDFAAGTFVLPDTVLVNRGLSNEQTIRVAGRFGSHAEAVNRATTPARLPVGVLGGTVYYQNGPSNAAVEHVLQGLIGTEGAVGVFELGGTNTDIGGFVARNAPVLVNHEVYLARFSSLQPTQPSASKVSEFVQGLTNGLDVTNINFTENNSNGCGSSGSIGCINNYLVKLGGNNADRNDPSGFALFYGNNHRTEVTNPIYRVGLLSGTDVGVALPALAPDGTASAVWNGQVHMTEGASGGTITPQNLTLTVNYTARTIGGTTAISGGDLSVNGNYSSRGMIIGNVTYDPSGGSDSVYDLIGVIGTQGAIGIFEGRGSASHVGGFIVKPPATP